MPQTTPPLSPANDSPRLGRINLSWTLFLVSVLGLFLELMLIRWIGTEVRIFAYLQNTVLVTCFLGLGMGALTCRKAATAGHVLRPLLLLSLLLAIPFTRICLGKISDMLTVDGEFLTSSYWTWAGPFQRMVRVVTGLGLTFLLLVLIWEIFVPLGRLVGRLFDDHPRTIWAYSVNVAGGLVGTWLFVLLSALSLPPVVWLAVPAGLLGILIALGRPERSRWLEGAMLGGLVAIGGLAGYEPGSLEVQWSPYQKLVLRNCERESPDSTEIGQYAIEVNNVGYQEMINLDPAHLAADPKHYPPKQRGLSQYDIPFQLHGRPRRALIMGAGNGNEAAGALRNGVEHVTVVEIDPVIIGFGRRYHPERPYDSPEVAVINDDPWAYLESSRDKFDVIEFGLLDSYMTTSHTNSRLDSCVHTRESIDQAKALLADGGIMTLSFFVQKPFVADPIARTLRAAFGQEPLCFTVQPSTYGRGGVIFVAGDLEQARTQIARNPRLTSMIAGWNEAALIDLAGATPVATDDWPFIYLKSAPIPSLYFMLAAQLLLLFAYGARRLELRGRIGSCQRVHCHFFFMGAAFLLLEVQNISKASVVLGNTWMVNAVIISSILVMILLANLAAARFPRLPMSTAYAGLFLSCIALYLLDITRLVFLPYAIKAALLGGLTSLPMLFSGIVFIRSFTAVVKKDQALGANILGALAGGLLQSLTFVVGLRALLLIVAGLYLAAFFTRPRVLANERPDSSLASGSKPKGPIGVGKRCHQPSFV